MAGVPYSLITHTGQMCPSATFFDSLTIVRENILPVPSLIAQF